MIFQSNLLLRILQISLFFCLHLFLVHSIILDVVGMWHSLVARIVRDDEAAGSNPVIPTISLNLRANHFGLLFLFSPALDKKSRSTQLLLFLFSGCLTMIFDGTDFPDLIFFIDHNDLRLIRLCFSLLHKSICHDNDNIPWLNAARSCAIQTDHP